MALDEATVTMSELLGVERRWFHIPAGCSVFPTPGPHYGLCGTLCTSGGRVLYHGDPGYDEAEKQACPDCTRLWAAGRR